MSLPLFMFLCGTVFGALACLLQLRLDVPTKTIAAEPVTSADPPAAGPPPECAKPEPEPTLATLLPPLSKVLFPLAEAIDHPSELPDMEEFQAVVAAFRRPDATLAVLTQHAFASNWPLACAAFIVLADHPERQSLCDRVLRHLDGLRPYVLMYALQFLACLDQRPPAGAALLGAPAWWKDNPVIPGFFHAYFERCAALGDDATFGADLDSKAGLALAAIDELLRKILHPFAAALLAELHYWDGARIDRDYLRTIGTIWDPDEQDPLLVSPPAWQERLATAEAVISQARPRSLLVSGDPRIGKTAFIELLGARLQQSGWTLFSASGNELMADQMYIGQLEGRIRKLVDALHARRRLVWHVRDLGQIATSGTHQGQTASILDQILPAIAAGNLILIGEASQTAATRLFQTRPSLRSLIEVLPLQPMQEADTLALAIEMAARITRHAGVAVPPQAVTATMELAQNYLGSGQLPGVVLELLKRAANRSISAGETALTPDSVIATLSQISGLPEIILDTRQRVELAQVTDFFARRVIGQDEAVKAVVDRIAMLKAGLIDPGRPIGVFLFAGPTGSGKTELAKTLAEYLFGSPDRMARLDMSEFQTPESTSKILGQRGDSTADSLIDRIRKQPFSVVLLDEFEKAHANCWDLFLQIFDDGRLSDAQGKEADFRHCFIILTSNLGATAHLGANLGFRASPSAYAEDQVLDTVARTFRPEFVNRLDKIIVFRPLSRDLMRSVLHKELARILERRGLRERDWAVEWEASAIEFLLDRGFSAEMGARRLKRAIDQHLLAPLAATLVEHRFPQGDQFLFVRSNGREIEVEFVDPDAEPAGSADPDSEAEGNLSLPSIVLRQTGSAAERASLAACWREISGELASEAWIAARDRLRLDLADPAIWARDDRFRIFSTLEMTDRLTEAARTAERLFQRYGAGGEHTARASRELAARLALQLFNLRQGLDDFAANAPIDALLRVDPALEAGGDSGKVADWCGRLTLMYRQWAAKRRMQIEEIAGYGAQETVIMHITGFGACRTLQAEAGLHLLDDPSLESARRMVARVTCVGGPDQSLPEAGKYAAARRLLDAAPVAPAIIRRYRDGPGPMVRDVANGWRTGRLDAVLAGDFDLMGAVSRPRVLAQ